MTELKQNFNVIKIINRAFENQNIFEYKFSVMKCFKIKRDKRLNAEVNRIMTTAFPVP